MPHLKHQHSCHYHTPQKPHADLNRARTIPSRRTCLSRRGCPRRTRRTPGLARLCLHPGLGNIKVLALRHDPRVLRRRPPEANLVLVARGGDKVGEGVLVLGRLDEVLDDGFLGAGGVGVVYQDDGEVGGVGGDGRPFYRVGLGEVPGVVCFRGGDCEG